MMKSLKFISTVLLTASVLSLSGCGKTSIVEEYSFGNATLRAGNTQLMLFTPFDLVSETIKGTERTVYGNQDAHVSVVVTYDPATGLTLDKAMDNAIAELSGHSEITITGKETKAAVVEGSNGKVCTVDYTLTAKGQQVAVVEQILVFEHEGYIWTVRYTYRQDDEMAKEVTDYIFKRFGNQY